MAFKRIKGMISESDPRVSQIGHPGPPWMISYADLMTELVAFFIILYALGAALDPKTKEAQVAAEQAGKDAGMKVETQITKEGVFISVEEQTDKPLFSSGQASLSADAENVIAKIAPILKKFPYDIEIQGHTDNVPVGRSTFASNWELSTARSTSVVRYLIDHHEFPPNRLGAIGYGEHRPLVENDTPEHRAKNRRVVFFLKTQILGEKDKKAQAASETATEAVPTASSPAAPEERPAPDATGPIK